MTPIQRNQVAAAILTVMGFVAAAPFLATPAKPVEPPAPMPVSYEPTHVRLPPPVDVAAKQTTTVCRRVVRRSIFPLFRRWRCRHQ